MESVRRKPSHSSCFEARTEAVGACRSLRSRSDGRAGRLIISLIISMLIIDFQDMRALQDKKLERANLVERN